MGGIRITNRWAIASAVNRSLNSLLVSVQSSTTCRPIIDRSCQGVVMFLYLLMDNGSGAEATRWPYWRS